VGDGKPQKGWWVWSGAGNDSVAVMVSERDGSLTGGCGVAEGWNTKISRRTFARRRDQRHRSTCCRYTGIRRAQRPTSQPFNRGGVHAASQSPVSHRLNAGTGTRTSRLVESLRSVSAIYRLLPLPHHPPSRRTLSTVYIIIGSLALRQSPARSCFRRSSRVLVLCRWLRACVISSAPIVTLSAWPSNRWVVQQVLHYRHLRDIKRIRG